MAERQNCFKCGSEFSPIAGMEDACPKCLLELGMDDTEVVITDVSSEGEDAVLPSTEELEALMPDYEIAELIGRGGMGAVYRARHRKLDRIVALKILLPSLGMDASFSERFLREARALAGLNHPGIVTVFDFGKAADHYFFAMEYVEGVSLREMMRGGELDSGQALLIVKKLCTALQYAHDHGVVHRDIKPDNILIRRDGEVKISDFGLAKLKGTETESHLTRTNQVIGTPHYMAPEQIERPLSVDHRADIYSLGVVFYELLTKELPLGLFNPPSRKVQIDVRLDGVVLKTLEKEPVKRYQSASAIESDVDHISRTEGTDTGRAEVQKRQREETVTRLVEKIMGFWDRCLHVQSRATSQAKEVIEKGKKCRGPASAWVQKSSVQIEKGAREGMKSLRAGAKDLDTKIRSSLVDIRKNPRWRRWIARFKSRKAKPLIECQGASAVASSAMVKKWKLHPHECNALTTWMSQARQAYMEVEERHSTLYASAGGQHTVDIEAFPRERRRMVKRFLKQVRSLRGRRFARSLRRSELDLELFPYGRERVWVEVCLEGTPFVENASNSDGKTLRYRPVPALALRYCEHPEAVSVVHHDARVRF